MTKKLVSYFFLILFLTTPALTQNSKTPAIVGQVTPFEINLNEFLIAGTNLYVPNTSGALTLVETYYAKDEANWLEFHDEVPENIKFEFFPHGGGPSNSSQGIVADMNNDGFLDIVYHPKYDAFDFNAARPLILAIMINDGTGKFSETKALEFPPINSFYERPALSVVDLNNDGTLDVVFAFDPPGSSVEANVDIFINKGNITFDRINLLYDFRTSNLTFLDNNQDGWMDFNSYLFTDGSSGIGTIFSKGPDSNGGKYLNSTLDFFKAFIPSTSSRNFVGSNNMKTTPDINGDGIEEILLWSTVKTRPSGVAAIAYSGPDGFNSEIIVDERPYSSALFEPIDINNDGIFEALTHTSLIQNVIFGAPGCSLNIQDLNSMQFLSNTDIRNQPNFGFCGRYSSVAYDFNNDGLKDIIATDSASEGSLDFFETRRDYTLNLVKSIQMPTGAITPGNFSRRSPLFGLTARVGTQTVPVDPMGRFVLNDLAPGTYTVELLKDGVSIASRIVTRPNNGKVGLVTFKDFVVPGTTGLTPTEVNTNTQQVTYTLWNGFLDMTNILELINPTESKNDIIVEFYSINGELVNVRRLTLDPFQQFDVILNDLYGFFKDSYGIVKIIHTRKLDGRLSNYRSAPNGTDYEFAFGVPFGEPLTGKSAVGFNTYQPSVNPSEANFAVANWLSVVNLADSAKSFRIKKYSQEGALLSTESTTIPAFGRVDIDGGHVNPGANFVGVNIIEPVDNSTPYLAQLMRYGYGEGDTFKFAFPLVAKGNDGLSKSFTTLATNFNAANWIEVINTTSKPVSATVRYRRSDGGSITDKIIIPAYSQLHFNANDKVGKDEVGYVEVESGTPGALATQSMYYFRSATGSILGMYGSQSRTAQSVAVVGSYNLFLGMDNLLKVSNTGSEDIDARVRVQNLDGSETNTTVTIKAKSTTEIALHETSTYGSIRDSYGVVTVETNSLNDSTKLIAELVRMRTSNIDGLLDFAAPTAVR